MPKNIVPTINISSILKNGFETPKSIKTMNNNRRRNTHTHTQQQCRHQWKWNLLLWKWKKYKKNF